MRTCGKLKNGAVLMTLISLCTVTDTWARTKLTTLPARSEIRIDLKNDTFILVEEERVINLQKGVNHVEFAWANTHIDMSSIQFREIETPGRVSLLNVNYPPNESALFWEVYSEKAGPGRFRISYLISNIDRNISYEAVSGRDEKFLSLKTYYTLRNMSGEKFENAGLEISFGQDFRKSFETGEAKKMLAAKFARVPVIKKYVFDPSTDGENVRMFYEIRNDVNSGLGRFSLPAGKIRIFQEDSAGTEAFLGEDWVPYTPVGEPMPAYLGQAKEVKVKRFLYLEKENIINPPLKDIRRVVKFQVENFKKDAVPLTIMEHPEGEWVLEGIELREETGERDKISERTVAHGGMIRTEKMDINNLRITFDVPVTTAKKYNIYAAIVLKNRW